MTILVDPSSGQQYDYAGLDEETLAVDRKRYGLVTPEELAARKKAEDEGPIVAAGRKLVSPVVGLTNLGMEAGLLDKGTPEEQAQWRASLERFGIASEAAEQEFPVASAISRRTCSPSA